MRDKVYQKIYAYHIVAGKCRFPLANSFECYKELLTAGKGKTAVANRIAESVLTLSLYAELLESAEDRICDIILNE